MQWSEQPQAGFTTGTPWLPVNPNYTGINARQALEDPDSGLSLLPGADPPATGTAHPDLRQL